MKGVASTALVLCALAAVAASGAAVKPQTFNLLEVNTSFVGAGGFDEMGNSPPKIGQGFVLGSDYYKWNGTKRGAHVGTLNASCTWLTAPTSASGKTVCTAVASLPGGKITAVGLTDGNKFRVPIVGGTGIYTGAKGYVEVTNNLGGENSNKSNDKFVITG